MRKCRKLGKK